MIVPNIPERALAQAAFWLLAVALVLTLALAAAALAINAWAGRVERRQARRAERWTPRLLDVLDGTLAPADFAARVRRREGEDVLRLLVTYALRLRGGDRQRLAAAATSVLPLARRRLTARSPEVRAYGVHALGLLSVRPPLDTLRTMMRDPSRRVGLVAARALAHTGSPHAADVMLAGLSRFAGAHTSTVASLLVQFGLRAGEPMTRALLDPRATWRARVAVVEALQRLSYVPASDAACALLVRPGVDRETQAALLRFLGEIGGLRAAAAIRPFCSHADERLRTQAVAALGQCGGGEDVWRLRRALGDADTGVAHHATEALALITPTSVPA